MTSDIELDSATGGGAVAPAAPIAVAELDGHVHELPAVVPVLLHRAPARAAVGARQQGHARPPRAPAPHVAARRPSARSRPRSPISARARAELEADPEFAELELTDEEWAEFHADAEVLVRRYFEMEDPRDVQVLGVELPRQRHHRRTASSIRGIIDRLELDADGELVVTDYKTGTAPERGLGTAEHGGRAHVLAAVRADVRSAARTRAAAVPLEAGDAS